MDYNSIDIIGEVTTEPERHGKDYSFSIISKRCKSVLEFDVIVRNDERPIDINRGDRVFIGKGGLFNKKGKICIAITEGSTLEVVRRRCNEGIVLV